MSDDVSRLLFERSSLSSMLLALCREAQFSELPAAVPPLVAPRGDEHVTPWLTDISERWGINCQAVSCTLAQLDRVLRRCAPAILHVRLDGEVRYLAIVERHGSRFGVLTSQGQVDFISEQTLRETVLAAWSPATAGFVEQCLSLTTGLDLKRRRRTLLEAFATERIDIGWIFCADAGAELPLLSKKLGIWRRLGMVALVSVAQVVALAYAWVLLAGGVLGGRGELSLLVAWAMLLTCAAFANVAALNEGKRALVDMSTLIRARLFRGALRMDRDEIRQQGSGRLLATVTESEVLTSIGLLGALALGVSVINLASAFVICSLVAGGSVLSLVLLAWCLGFGWLVARYLRTRAEWSQQRFQLAQSSFENVIGHRTRAVQQPASRWHIEEDAELAAYGKLARRLDRLSLLLAVVPARGWLLVGLLCMLPSTLSSGGSALGLAATMGGVLQAHAALAAISTNVVPLCSAIVAWRQLGPLWQSAKQRPAAGTPLTLRHETRRADGSNAAGDSGTLSVRGVSFAYDTHRDPVLRDVSLEVQRGERLLVEGPSGGGKSTLAAIIAGLRTPAFGQVLLDGLDRTSVGDVAWRRAVVQVPQFHENHVFSASLAFNLLFGAEWPASEQSLAEARQVCESLGLGPLLRAMPLGLAQVVGDTGWQLSHGERSRIFLARALLQKPRVLILDESLGALDPKTSRECLNVVCQRDLTLIAIEHR